MSFGKIIQGIQIIASTILVTQQVTIEIIKSQIKSFVSKNEDQFKAINDIYKTLLKVHQLNILQDNLQKVSDSLILTWDVIAKNFNEKVQLAQKIASQFQDIQLSKYDFTLQDGFNLSFTTILTAYQINKFLSPKQGFKAKTPERVIKRVKGAMIKQPIIVQKIKLVNGQQIEHKKGEIEVKKKITKTKGSIEGRYKVEMGGNIQGALSAPKKNSVWSKIKKFGSKHSGKILGALRVLGLIALMYGVYQQAQQIARLLEEWKSMQKQYGQKGNFKIKQIELINLVIICGQHFSNLAYASYACLQLLSNTYAIMALTYGSFNQILMKKSIQYSPKQNSLNIQFCKETNKFYESLCSIDVGQQSSKDDMLNALNNVKNYLQTYIKAYNPINVFDKLTQIIGRYSIESSIFTINVLVKQTILTDFKTDIAKLFAKRNQLLIQYPGKQLQIDQSNVTSVINSYFRLMKNLRPDQKLKIILSYEYISQLTEDQQQKIGNLIASFANKIYSQSSNGDKLFYKDLSSYKHDKSYGQMLNTSYAIPNCFPMFFESQEKKREYLDNFKAKSSIFDAKLQVYNSQLYTIEEQLPVIECREVYNKLQIEGKQMNKIQFCKKIIFKVKNTNALDYLPYLVIFEEIDQQWKGKIQKL